MARDKAAENASHFITERIKQAKLLRETFEGHPPLVISPYDAELYGHWWFEGPQFIDFFFKKIHFDHDEAVGFCSWIGNPESRKSPGVMH